MKEVNENSNNKILVSVLQSIVFKCDYRNKGCAKRISYEDF